MQSNRYLIHTAVTFLSSACFLAQAGTIQGTITGSTVTAPATKNHPATLDDTNTATTIDISYFTYCPWIAAGAAAYPGYNFVFAGLAPNSGAFSPPTGLDVNAVDPGDFSISNYIP